MFISVFVVLNSLMRKNMRIMLMMLVDSVVLMLSLNSVVLIDGGVENMLWNWLLVKKNDRIVMLMMLIRIVLCMCRWLSVMIVKKLMIVRIVLCLCRLLSVMSVVGLLMIMFDVFSEMMLRNRLMLVVMEICSDFGMLLMIVLCMWNSVMSRNR